MWLKFIGVDETFRSLIDKPDFMSLCMVMNLGMNQLNKKRGHKQRYGQQCFVCAFFLIHCLKNKDI